MQKNQDEFRTPPSPDPLAGWCACLSGTVTSGQKLPRAVGQQHPSPRRAANLQERKHTCQLTTSETAAGDGTPQAPRRPTASTARGASPRQTREERRPGRSGGCPSPPVPSGRALPIDCVKRALGLGQGQPERDDASPTRSAAGRAGTTTAGTTRAGFTGDSSALGEVKPLRGGDRTGTEAPMPSEGRPWCSWEP